MKIPKPNSGHDGWRWLDWIVGVTLVWAAATIIVPFGAVAVVSFATRETYGWIQWTATLTNYRDIWHPLYGRILMQSIGLSTVTTLCALALGFPLAYLIARASPRWQPFWLVLILVPLWTNFLVRTYAWMVLLRSEGLINSLFLHVGLIQEPLSMLYTPSAVVIGLVYGYLPFMVLPIYAAMERVPRSLEEAARDLYAGFWTSIGRVVVPLVAPGIAAGCLLVFLAGLGAYLTPDLLGGAKTMMVANLIQHEFLVVRDWPLGSAVSVVLMALALAIVAAVRRIHHAIVS
ncbi:spermidine/putrescine ABC transporter permease [Nitrospira sp.]|nr:spermidine/putrescine ABC transporter permease [Nitrospira sp.]